MFNGIVCYNMINTYRREDLLRLVYTFSDSPNKSEINVYDLRFCFELFLEIHARGKELVIWYLI